MMTWHCIAHLLLCLLHNVVSLWRRFVTAEELVSLLLIGLIEESARALVVLDVEG